MNPIKTPGGVHTLQFGTTPINFELLYSARKTLSLRVHPDSTVEVDVPLGTDPETIEKFVRRRGAWVLRNLRDLAAYHHPSAVLPHRYVSGEAYRYLGRQYRLKVVEDTIERIVLSRGYLTVGVVDERDNRRIRALVSAWYRAHAERFFTDRLAVCCAQVAPLGISRPPLAIRLMQKRWGSCSAKGMLTLNLKLIQAPRSLIDYVILHELCHLKEHNHSAHFWSLLGRVSPGWERLRDELNHYEFGEI